MRLLLICTTIFASNTDSARVFAIELHPDQDSSGILKEIPVAVAVPVLPNSAIESVPEFQSVQGTLVYDLPQDRNKILDLSDERLNGIEKIEIWIKTLVYDDCLIRVFEHLHITCIACLGNIQCFTLEGIRLHSIRLHTRYQAE
jgi:hypothetical protein